MKRIISTAGIIMLCLMAVAIAGDDKPWFGGTDCEMCTFWFSNPEMVQHMEWEQHKISNGMLSMSEVDEEYLDAYREANRKSEELGKKLMSGYEANLCGSCNAIGSCLGHGAAMEKVETEEGMIMLLTSDKPEVVDEIHAMVDRNQEEMAKMMGSMDHEDHDHGHDHDDHHGHDH